MQCDPIQIDGRRHELKATIYVIQSKYSYRSLDITVPQGSVFKVRKLFVFNFAVPSVYPG
ncbi:hypothetical protein [Lentilactobacillus kefiri]|uniref:hypothetical protein n=1 Tax=Lentilactobacillus kefiri TaxID=33962 RepID=UPI000B16C76E|nr:hypothetical protein [Lentilactobacillus kefiri]UOD78203.1 hypothetical protein MTO92_11195 [Lentilactobacillus kefiri]